jgi:hypothetical protein
MDKEWDIHLKEKHYQYGFMIFGCRVCYAVRKLIFPWNE